MALNEDALVDVLVAQLDVSLTLIRHHEALAETVLSKLGIAPAAQSSGLVELLLSTELLKRRLQSLRSQS
jgi:hypothetical protein